MEESSLVSFIKMQGAGNDFIIIDNRDNLLSEEEIVTLAPDLCHRRFGIGADGIITLQQPEKTECDYAMFYRNADGSDAGMCGNGARCLALYASSLGLGEELTFNVHETTYTARVKPSDDKVTLYFPLTIQAEKVTLNNEGQESMLQLHTGTEHVVKQVPPSTLGDHDFLTQTGRQIRNHPRFNPPGTNVNFINGTSKTALELQTYEKGVEGLTLACGTGAIASALAWHHIQGLGEAENASMDVSTKGGNLQIGYSFNTDINSYSNIRLTGEARFVFEGIYKR